MATSSFYNTVHTVRGSEIEQLADAYDKAKNYWQHNVKNQSEDFKFTELNEELTDKLITNYRS